MNLTAKGRACPMIPVFIHTKTRMLLQNSSTREGSSFAFSTTFLSCKEAEE